MMPELRTCTVSYRDMEGVTHSVDVSAASLYEAAVLGLKAFEQMGWADHPVGFMEIAVKSPAVKHQVPVVKVTNWLRTAGRTPRDVALKTRLKEILSKPLPPWNRLYLQTFDKMAQFVEGSDRPSLLLSFALPCGSPQR